MKPILTVLDFPALKSKALFVNGKMIVCADPRMGDPLYLIDEAAEQLAASHQVAITYQTSHLNRLPQDAALDLCIHGGGSSH